MPLRTATSLPEFHDSWKSDSRNLCRVIPSPLSDSTKRVQTVVFNRSEGNLGQAVVEGLLRKEMPSECSLGSVSSAGSSDEGFQFEIVFPVDDGGVPDKDVILGPWEFVGIAPDPASPAVCQEKEPCRTSYIARLTQLFMLIFTFLNGGRFFGMDHSAGYLPNQKG